MDTKQYEEKITSQIKCVDFLKFKFNNTQFFIEDIKISENNFLEFISKCTIIYKNKEYNFQKYLEDLESTSKKFQPDSVDNYYIENCDEIYETDKNYYRILKFFNSISFNITCAKYYADKSYQKLPENLYNNITYANIYLERRFNFLSSIMWYSTCRDYLLQIFCTKFNLYSEFTDKTIESMEFEELVKLCELKKIENIKNKYKNNSEFLEWYKKLKICINDLKNLNTLNNKLKHRGGCYLKNFNGNYLINDIKLHYFNLSEIDIDEDYDLLITAHNNIVKCYDYFLNQINNELNLLFKRNDIK